MGFRNINTPRFYIDYLQYWSITGLLGSNHYIWNTTEYPTSGDTDAYKAVMNIIGLNPANQTKVTWDGTGAGGYNYNIKLKETFPVDRVNFVGLLGHNFGSPNFTNSDIEFNFQYKITGDVFPHIKLTDEWIINGDRDDNSIHNILLDGFTLCSADGSTSDAFPLTDENDDAGLQPNIRGLSANDFDHQFSLGSLLMGRYYDMPTSPDLNVQLIHEWDGVKTTQTKSGATLTNTMYTGPPNWNNKKAWQLGRHPYYTSGRRSWRLTWSEVADSDLEAYSPYGNKWSSDTGTPTLEESGDNWFEHVLYYTNGPRNSFLFSPDPSIEYYNDGTNPPRVPELAICKFDMRTFSKKQTSFKRYTHSITVREVW